MEEPLFGGDVGGILVRHLSTIQPPVNARLEEMVAVTEQKVKKAMAVVDGGNDAGYERRRLRRCMGCKGLQRPSKPVIDSQFFPQADFW